MKPFNFEDEMEESNIRNFIEQAEFIDPTFSRLELFPVLYSFFVCVSLSFLVRYFYISYSTSVAGKMNIGNVLPLLASIVFLIILVVKSSIALSLGLVGALSIVRFRTPIKEPEELVYLFLAIGIGLGCAANYIFITTLLTSLILIFVYFFLSGDKIVKGIDEYNLTINWSSDNLKFNQLIEAFEAHASLISLIRFSVNPGANSAIFLIESSDSSSIEGMISKIKDLDPQASVTLSSPNTNW
ncbi:DUF4956 domain-containing protein [Gammaproteobacteria bacterium]|jgi:hypothetical protein|nr:DUF4956 domain-containing protein [Gammaproteobacteria bacterium]